MKKSVILMAGLLAMALAGSAHATGTPMFAVQQGTTDQMVVDQTGWIGIGTSTPVSPFHVVSNAANQNGAGFVYNVTDIGTGGVLSALTAPVFSFMRNNDSALVGSNNGLPRALDRLGIFNFGAKMGSGNSNFASIFASSEIDAVYTDPTHVLGVGQIVFQTAHQTTPTTSSLTAKLKLTSLGNLLIPTPTTNIGGGRLGIGTTAPTSPLHVSGLPVYATQVAAQADAALTAGAIYTNGSGALFIKY